MNRFERIFVAMPNDGSREDLWCDYIKPIAASLPTKITRLYPVSPKQNAVSRIIQEIDGCDALIALAFDRNPHIYFEIGYALARRKTCIVVTDDEGIGTFFKANAIVIFFSDRSGDLSDLLSAALISGATESGNSS